METDKSVTVMDSKQWAVSLRTDAAEERGSSNKFTENNTALQTGMGWGSSLRECKLPATSQHVVLRSATWP